MNRKLVAYFSATGTTTKLAELLADAIGADIFEIQPKIPYTAADLDWHNEHSRSSLEMKDSSSRPAIANKRDNMIEYEYCLCRLSDLVVCSSNHYQYISRKL